ncbi:MAG: primosomal protein N', partial [Gemmatimonadetes bacterium]|nr:primosomal protein N' [Gemmatimonadota bacterium]
MASAASGITADGTGEPGKGSLVSVALPIPVAQAFTYEVEGPAPAVGSRVLVPFGKGVQIGFVVGEGTKVPRLKRVVACLDDVPTLSGELLDLARWIAEYYVAPLGQVLRSVVPGPLVDRSRDHLVALRSPPPGAQLSERETALLSHLGPPGESRSAQAVRRAMGGKGSFWPLVRRLQGAGLLGHVTVPPRPPSPLKRRVLVLEREVGTLSELDAVFGRSVRQRDVYERLVGVGGRVPLAAVLEEGFSRSVVNGLVTKGLARYEEEEVLRDPFAGTGGEPGDLPPLTTAQSDAIRGLEGLLTSGRTALLHGVTGSGKTRVYVEILKRVVDGGGGGIVLVPEISLTPQTVQRFRQAFGDAVSVLHSGLSDGERFDAWRSLREGRRRVAIGARSAVFAPVQDLGVLIVDEEHDGSYKQSDAPRYHARDVAVVRARRHGALCLLGSATPSLESWVNAGTGKYERFDLPDRVGGGSLPEVRVVDLRSGSRQAGEGRRDSAAGPSSRVGPADGSTPPDSAAGRILTPPLRDALAERLRGREQSVVLLNRRGYAAFALCQECG